MRYDLNLASRPFVNTSVPAILAGVAVVGIVVFTVFNLYVLYTSAGGGSYRERIDAAKENNRELEAEIQRLEREIRDINVSKLSSQTEFANDLTRKRNRNLSLMLDRLEEVVGDKEVRMRSVTTRIEEETVHLRLNVEDEDDEALLLVDAMRDSPHFLDAYIKEESILSENPGKSWVIEVLYIISERE